MVVVCGLMLCFVMVDGGCGRVKNFMCYLCVGLLGCWFFEVNVFGFECVKFGIGCYVDCEVEL